MTFNRIRTLMWTLGLLVGAFFVFGSMGAKPAHAMQYRSSSYPYTSSSYHMSSYHKPHYSNKYKRSYSTYYTSYGNYGNSYGNYNYSRPTVYTYPVSYVTYTYPTYYDNGYNNYWDGNSYASNYGCYGNYDCYHTTCSPGAYSCSHYCSGSYGGPY